MSQTVGSCCGGLRAHGIAKARKGAALTHPVDFTGQLLAGVVRKVPPVGCK